MCGCVCMCVVCPTCYTGGLFLPRWSPSVLSLTTSLSGVKPALTNAPTSSKDLSSIFCPSTSTMASPRSRPALWPEPPDATWVSRGSRKGTQDIKVKPIVLNEWFGMRHKMGRCVIYCTRLSLFSVCYFLLRIFLYFYFDLMV